MSHDVECVVAGAGVVGLAVARALAQAGREVIVVEAEKSFGMGTSSRNSEVVHAGIYYTPGSLKARLCVAGLAWRLVLRFVFTTREYGLKEGARAIFRIPLANVIAIMAGRRAFAAYWRSLTGGAVDWDKTVHSAHPAFETIKPARVLTMPRRSRA